VKRLLLFLIFLVFFLSFLSTSVFAADDIINVAGYSNTASRLPLTSIIRVPPFSQNYANRLSRLI
jgi:hypothetical protein